MHNVSQLAVVADPRFPDIFPAIVFRAVVLISDGNSGEGSTMAVATWGADSFLVFEENKGSAHGYVISIVAHRK